MGAQPINWFACHRRGELQVLLNACSISVGVAGTRGIEDVNTRRQGVTPCAGSFRSFICGMSQLKLLEDLKNALLCAGRPVDLHLQYFQGPMPCLLHDASSVSEQSLSGMAILTLPNHVRKGWYFTGFRTQQCSQRC